jgi:hypothetical protein
VEAPSAWVLAMIVWDGRRWRESSRYLGGKVPSAVVATSDPCDPCSSVVRVVFSSSPRNLQFVKELSCCPPRRVFNRQFLAVLASLAISEFYPLVNPSTPPYPLPIHPMSSQFGVGFIPVAFGMGSLSIPSVAKVDFYWLINRRRHILALFVGKTKHEEGH